MFLMTEMNYEELVSRLDLLQHNVWKIEEKATGTVAMLSKTHADMEELKASQEVLGEKLDKLDAEIRALRNRNGNG